MNAAPDELRRFLAKVRIDENGCWRWTAGHNRKGYGQFKYRRKDMGAHRASHLIFVGPIPDGCEIDHLCRVRDCVSPLHLEAVTHAVNVARGTTGMFPHGHRTHCDYGHPFDEENTATRADGGGRVCRICRRERTREWRERNVELVRARDRELKRRLSDEAGKPSRWPGRVHPRYQEKAA